MTDIQKARANWLDAESRILALQKENSDLAQRNYELQMKLSIAEMQATYLQSFSLGLAAAFLR
jgi:hypothetical protein